MLGAHRTVSVGCRSPLKLSAAFTPDFDLGELGCFFRV